MNSDPGDYTVLYAKMIVLLAVMVFCLYVVACDEETKTRVMHYTAIGVPQ